MTKRAKKAVTKNLAKARAALAAKRALAKQEASRVLAPSPFVAPEVFKPAEKAEKAVTLQDIFQHSSKLVDMIRAFDTRLVGTLR